MRFYRRKCKAKEDPSRFPWCVPQGLPDDVHLIAKEIVRLGRWDETLGKRYQRHMRIWTGLAYGLGAPAAVLAAVAGFLATNSSKHNTVVGVLALVSAAMGGLLAFLNPASRASSADARRKVHFRTSNWVRYVITAELPKANFEAAGKLLGKLRSMDDDGRTAFTIGPRIGKREESIDSLDPPSEP
jgi:hypothetical protein